MHETCAADIWLHDFADKIAETLNRTLVQSSLPGHVFQTPSRVLNRGLRDRSLQRGYHAALTGAFVFVESAVGAFQEFLRRFTGSIVGPPAGILQAQLIIVELELEAFEARQNVPDFFGAALRKQGHELVAAQTHSEI